MNTHRRPGPQFREACNTRGGALIAAMVLVVIAGIMGATILFATSTDLQISGNYRRAWATFYAAEAGLTESRQRLRGSPGNDLLYLGDPSPSPQANWSIYLVSQADWKPEDDAHYNTLLTNYFPLPENLTNTLVLPNSVQGELAYWTKVQHKTEYAAEQAGHRVGSPHYIDGDGVTTLHSASTQGQLIHYGYSTATGTKPEQFTSGTQTLYAPVEIITSHGQVEGADSILHVDVAHPPGPPIWAPLYVGNQVVLSGSSITIGGFDTCGLLPTGRPPLSLSPSAVLVGTATLTGNPPIPQVSAKFLDLAQHIQDLKKGANTVSANLGGVNLGKATAPALHYAEPTSGTLTLTNVTGYGILLVKGSLQVVPPFKWEGLIVVSETMVVEAGAGPVFIGGVLYVDQLQAVHNEITIHLDACPIGASLRTLPVRVLTWRQLL